MVANIEIEAKVLISKEDYNTVVEHFRSEVTSEFDQTNYYIDSTDFKLKQLGIGLRIRKSKDHYLITLKAPMSEGLLEKDQNINKSIYDSFAKKNIFPEGTIREFVKMLGIDTSELKILTSLITHRIEVDYGSLASILSIDKNDYNGLTDYELEFEGNAIEKAKDQLKEICEQCGIVYKENLISKQSRALSSIR